MGTSKSKRGLATPLESTRVHVVVGGFPPGNHAGHDMDYARRQLLSLLGDCDGVSASVSGDYADLERYLPESRLLITYAAGPYPEDAQNRKLRSWLEEGGRWLALHGTSGGRHEPDPERPEARRMMKLSFHDTLGSRFIHHPPLRRYTVDVIDPDHPLAKGLPASFEVADEPYFLVPEGDEQCHYFLTTDLPKDPTPTAAAWRRFLSYDHESALMPDGHSRAVGYTKALGKGGVAYIALGHCHSPYSNMQPSVDPSLASDEKTPPVFHGAWETEGFQTLLRNGVAWGLEAQR